MATTDAQRQQTYRSRLATSGRRRITAIVNNEAADQLRAIAAANAEPPGRALERVLAATVPSGGSPADQIGGKCGARLRNLRGVFDLATSDAGVTAGAEFVRSVRGVALAEDGAARRASKAGRRTGAKGGV